MGQRSWLNVLFCCFTISGLGGCGLQDIKLIINHPTAADLKGKVGKNPGPSPQYTFKINGFDIKTLRSRSLDTDIVSLTVEVGGTTYGPIIKSMGDLSGPDVKNLKKDEELKPSSNPITDVVIGPISGIGKDDSVTIIYQILNHGHSSYEASQQLVSQVFDVIEEVGEVGTALNPAFIIAGLFLNYGSNLLFANCDGPVAMARIDKVSHEGKALVGYPVAADHPVKLLTGETLGILPFVGDIYTKTDRYPPVIRSPAGCGANSEYFVTWSITKS